MASLPKGGGYMYLLDKDLNDIQKALIADKEILRLLDLTGKPPIEIAETIIKRSKWDDLAGNKKRLCIYPLPSRSTRNDILFEEVIEIDCHVPAIQDFQARQIIGRVIDVLKTKSINGRYLNFKGIQGEISTMTGFYCVGVRFGYFSPV